MFVNTDCGCSSQIPKAAAILLPSQAEVWSSIYWNHFGAHSQWREISKSRVFWLMIDACGYLQNYLQKKIETDRNFLVEFRCHASFPLPGWCPSWRFCGFFFESPGRKQQRKRWTLGWHSMVPGWLKGILTMFWYTVIRTSLGIIPDIIQPGFWCGPYIWWWRLHPGRSFPPHGFHGPFLLLALARLVVWLPVIYPVMGSFDIEKIQPPLYFHRQIYDWIISWLLFYVPFLPFPARNLWTKQSRHTWRIMPVSTWSKTSDSKPPK